MKKKHSTKDDGFVSIPSSVLPSGKVDIKGMKLPSLVTSKNFTNDQIASEIVSRHPENTFLSLLEWTESMELALRLRREGLFSYHHEREIILVILKLTPTTPNDLAIFRQILKNDWLSQGIKTAVKEQLEKLNR